MNIIFRDHEGHELGRIAHHNIHEILIPAFKEDSHDMFIKRVFQNHPNVNTWQILNMVTDNLDVYLKLRPIAPISSLKDFADKQYKKPKDFLKKFQIIEVDFGFYSDVFNDQGQRRKNHEHTHTLLIGELHKRRPCLVLSVKESQIQIIPLSTKPSKQKNPKTILLNALPKTMDSRYHQKTTSVLLNMIQTVSSARVYPPRSASGKYEHKYTLFRIGADDQDKINAALAEQYNYEITMQNRQLKQRLANLQQEKAKLLELSNRLRVNAQQTQQEKNDLEQFILRLGQDLDLGDGVQKIMSHYDRQF